MTHQRALRYRIPAWTKLASGEVAVISTIDPDTFDSHEYELVDGDNSEE